MASGFFVFLAMTLTHFVHAAAGDTPWKGYGTLTGAANFNPRIREGCDSDFETYKRRNHPFCTQNTQKYNLIQA